MSYSEHVRTECLFGRRSGRNWIDAHAPLPAGRSCYPLVGFAAAREKDKGAGRIEIGDTCFGNEEGSAEAGQPCIHLSAFAGMTGVGGKLFDYRNALGCNGRSHIAPLRCTARHSRRRVTARCAQNTLRAAQLFAEATTQRSRLTDVYRDNLSVVDPRCERRRLCRPGWPLPAVRKVRN